MSLAVASHQPRGVDERPGSGRGSSPREATAKALDVPTNPALAQAMATTSAARDKVEFLIYAAQRHQDYAKGYLPRVLGNDPTLLELDLQRTHLTDVSLATLADALRLNSVLTSLNLADNYIEHDGGMALAEMLEFNSTLQQLNVGDNDLGPPACLRMIQALRRNDTLDLLNADGNTTLTGEHLNELYCAVKLNTQPRLLKRTVEALRAQDLTQSLRLVDLSYSEEAEDGESLSAYLDDFSAQALADVLRGNRTTEVLKLRNNRIGDEGARQLAWMLEGNTALDEVDLFGNVVGAAGCQAFVEVLTEHNNYLTKLNLRGNCASDNMLIELDWALVLNRQPLNLKKFIAPVRANDPDLVALKFDEHLSQRYYDDVSARVLSDALQRNTCITSLELPNNIITEVGAHFLADMLLVNNTLKHLDLGGNKIESGVKWLAQALKVNRGLSSIVLRANNIDDAEGADFADMLLLNTTLVEVDLSGNRLRHCGKAFVNAFLANPSLQELFLEGNEIEEVLMFQVAQGRQLNHEPRHLRNLIPLLGSKECPKDVDLSYSADVHDRPLDDTSASILATALENNYTVTSLNLSDNDITFEGIQSLCKMLYQNYYTLTHLNLSRCRDLGPDTCEALTEVLGVHKNLTSLDISYNNLGDEGCRFLMNRVQQSSHLVHLDIEGCRCSRTTFKRTSVLTMANRYAPDLKSRFINIMDGKEAPQVLDMSAYSDFEGWDYQDHRYDKAPEVVALALMDFSFFSVFRFCKNRVGDAGCAVLSKLFSHHCFITQLDLSHNRITDAGADSLIALVKARHEILNIFVDQNPMSQEKVDAIAYYTQYNRQPKYIKDLLVSAEANSPEFTAIDISNVVSQHMADQGAEFLASAMRHNSTVTSMNLSNNHVATKGACFIADMLTHNTTVRTFTFNNNIIEGMAPAEAFAEMLRHNTTLTSLSLRMNEINNEGALLILEALKINDTLLKLDLRDNGLPEETVSRLQSAVALNSAAQFKTVLPSIRDNTVEAVDFSGKGYSDSLVNSLALALKDNTSVTALDVSKNALTDAGAQFLANAVVDHPALKRLDLSHNRLTSAVCEPMAEFLCRNGVLQYLLLGYNDIDPASTHCFKQAMHINTSLLDLSFHGCTDFEEEHLEQIEGLCLNSQPMLKNAMAPLRQSSRTLDSLDFSRGQFQDSLEGLSSYDEASLKTVCTHTDVSCKLLSSALPDNTALRTLNLNNGHVTDRGVAALCRALELNRTVHTLSVANNFLTSASAQSVAAVLLCNGILTNINLRRNQIEEEGAEAVLGALEVNHTCRVFNLDLNPISDATQRKLGFAITLNHQPRSLKSALAALREGERVVETIKADADDEGRPYDDVSGQIIADALRQGGPVTAVDLYGHKVGDVGGTALAQMLRTNTTLKSLDLEGNAMSGCAWEFIESMELNTTLTELNVSRNAFKEYDVNRLTTLATLALHPVPLKRVVMNLMSFQSSQTEICIECLSPASVHQHLLRHPLHTDLFQREGLEQRLTQPQPAERRLCMTDESVKLVAENLKTDIYCRSLSLAHNRISGVGLGYIADYLRINPQTLTCLNLSHNMIQDDGFHALAKAMDKNKALTDLNFADNFMTDGAGKVWLKLVKFTPTIQVLDVAGNPLDGDLSSSIELNVRLNHKNPNFRDPLLRTMAHDPTLTSLDLGEFKSRGWYDAECTELVVKSMCANLNVTKVSIRFNDVDDADMPHLVALVENQTLTELDLSNNFIARCEPLAAALAVNRGLINFDLSYNRLLPPEALAIGKALRQNKRLKALNVSGNKFGEVGAIHLVEAVKYNRHLEGLSMDAMGVSDHMMEQLEWALKECYDV